MAHMVSWVMQASVATVWTLADWPGQLHRGYGFFEAFSVTKTLSSKPIQKGLISVLMKQFGLYEQFRKRSA